KFGGGNISAAQWLTEEICLHKAESEKRFLPQKFWEDDEWAKFFRQQIPAANNLLKKYPAQAIMAAIKNPRAKKIFSLRAAFLIPIIEDEVKKLKLFESKAKESEVKEISTTPSPRPQ